MTGRVLDVEPSAQPKVPPPDLILQASPNWTAVIFFACLAGLHLWNAFNSFAHHRWAGHMSLLLGSVFVVVSIVFSRIRYQLSFHPKWRVICIRNGLGRFKYRRSISFSDVHAVRLTMSRAPDFPISRIEVLCDNEDIECPPTSIPREEALCLAIMMGVELIKVYDRGVESARNV